MRDVHGSAISPQTLKVLNLVVMAVLVAPIAHNLFAREYASALILCLQEVVGAVTLILVHRKQYDVAAHLSCISVLALAISLVATSTHGVWGVAMMTFPAVILPFALLVDRRWYLSYATASLLGIVGVELAQWQGWLRSAGNVWTFRHLIDALIIQGTSAYAVRRVGDAIDRSLQKARAAEHEERKARQEIEAILSALPDLLFQLDGEGRFRGAHVNPTHPLFLPIEQAMGKVIEEILPPQPAATCRRALDEAKATGRHQGAVYSLPMAGGERWFELSMARTGEGSEMRIITLVRDVSGRVRAERRLRLLNAGFLSLGPRTDENIARLTSLLTELVEADCACLVGRGPSGPNILACHPAEQGAPSPPCCRSLPETLDHEDIRLVVEPQPDGTGVRARRTIRLSDGSALMLGARWNTLRELDGEERNLVEIVAAAIGLEKERAHFESRFLQAQKMESLGRLAGGVAHDLNNMLTPILGYADMIHEDAAGHPEMRESLEQIRKAAQNARDLVQQLLTVSRKNLVQPKVMDLNAVIEDFLPILGRTLRANIAIESQLSSHQCQVRLDKGQFTQVLLNLAVNAQDAMPNGGILRIATRPAPPSGAGLEAQRFVEVTISDTGQGMPPEVASRCFEPFFTTKDQGTGLGLATVYGIVEHHGGTVRVDSRPGKGTTFILTLPESAAPAVEVREEDARTPMPRTLRTVLIVEDNPQVRALAERILRKQDLQVIAADSGEAALALPDAELSRVDLLLSDLMLPGIHGRELYTRLSARYPRLKVVYMSGYAEAILEKREVAEGSVGFLQKPFTVASLSNMVAESLGQPGR